MRERAVNKHGMGPWTRSPMISLLGTALALGAPVSSVSAQEAVDARIQALERQMEEMRRTMQSMEAELEDLRKAPPPEVVPAPPEEQPSVVRDQSPAETITTTEEATEPVVSSSQPEIKVSLSGQVNRAINFANDGDSTKAYFVDNDVSNSRIPGARPRQLQRGCPIWRSARSCIQSEQLLRCEPGQRRRR